LGKRARSWRLSVTKASRIMLPYAYPGVSLWQGLGFLVTPADVLNHTPAYRAFGGICPFWLWGIAFLAGFFGCAYSLICDRRLYPFILAFLMGLFIVLGTTAMGAIFTTGAAPMAPALAYFAALACFASMTSVDSGERN
jgi:hypothetical protein